MLPQKLKNMEERYRIINELFLKMRKGFIVVKNIKFEIMANFRECGFMGYGYNKLKKYKNIHEGERCFIIATGPSLSLEDIEKLRSEYTISMNSICLALGKVNWKPTYYGIQDEKVFEKVEKVLYDTELKRVFISSNIAKKYDVPDEWIKFPLNKEYHSYEQRFHQKYFAKFSKDCYRAVYDGYTITYSLLQLAIYMGFNEIYLLGADNNYEIGKPQHFIEHGHFDSNYDKAKERMTVGYKKAKEYADANGIRIFNSTRGGMLEVFPRVKLEEVLGLKDDK